MPNEIVLIYTYVLFIFFAILFGIDWEDYNLRDCEGFNKHHFKGEKAAPKAAPKAALKETKKKSEEELSKHPEG